jgi:hypothetical protein
VARCGTIGRSGYPEDRLVFVKRSVEETIPCARALQKRSDNNGCAASLSPQTLLFATQSLARSIA